MSDQIKETSVFGVPGKIIGPRIGEAKRGEPAERIIKQVFTSGMRATKEFGPGGQMQVTIRWDDECSNGHNSFAITAEVWTSESRRRHDVAACGCLHDDIAKVFPEFAQLIKWHLMSEDGPWGYINNTVYHAGDRDYNGRRKGEPSQFETWLYESGAKMGHKISDVKRRIIVNHREAEFTTQQRVYLEPICVPYNGISTHTYAPKFTVSSYPYQWALCPFDSEREAKEFIDMLHGQEYHTEEVPIAWSEGKERDHAAARESAVWPDATDEQLCLPKEELTKLLEARLPALMAEFKQVVSDIGFVWSL